MATSLTAGQQLACQLSMLTAASADLRQFRGSPEARDLFWQARELRDAAYRGVGPVWMPRSFMGRRFRADWALERLRFRVGLSTNTWWTDAEHPNRHSLEGDLRLVLAHLEDVA